MSPQTADRLCLFVALVVPIGLVLRWGCLGVGLGTLVQWWALILAGLLLSKLDPGRDNGMLDALWRFTGWILSFLYCLVVYGLKKGIIGLWKVAHGAPSPFDPAIASLRRLARPATRRPRERFTLRGVILGMGIAVMILLLERFAFVLIMTAHWDASRLSKAAALVRLNVMGFGVVAVIWLWRRYARYD